MTQPTHPESTEDFGDFGVVELTSCSPPKPLRFDDASTPPISPSWPTGSKEIPHCQAARFESYARSFGNRFVPTVLPDSAAGDVGWLGVAHSVVTTSLKDAAGEPTRSARDDIIRFLRHRLTDDRSPGTPG